MLHLMIEFLNYLSKNFKKFNLVKRLKGSNSKKLIIILVNTFILLPYFLIILDHFFKLNIIVLVLVSLPVSVIAMAIGMAIKK